MQKYLDVVEQAKNCHTSGELQKAQFLYEHLLGAQPDDGFVLYLYGTLLSQIQAFGSAITMLRAATKYAPNLTEAWHNLGVAYRSEGHTELARKAYAEVIRQEPKNDDAIAMMAGAFVNTGDPQKAITWADNALRINPNNPHARNHKALALLEQGKYREAWPYYKTRYEIPALEQHKRPYPCPMWDGRPVHKLAIHGEQGLGDEVMFLSCLPDLKARAGEIVIECADRLVSLIERSFGYETYPTHEDLIAAHPDVDAYIPMGDLPSLCRYEKSDFPGSAYLTPDGAKVQEFRERLGKLGPGPYIGIAWHGGTKGTHQEIRNPPIDCWASIAERATCVSIQYGEHGAEGAVALNIPHNQEALDNLDDFAALIAALDLVISPCQTAIHFAGALGRECWCLTPSAPAWRYGIKGDMPWYRSVKLYRQTGEWAEVFDQVSKDLNDFIRVYRTKQAAA